MKLKVAIRKFDEELNLFLTKIIWNADLKKKPEVPSSEHYYNQLKSLRPANLEEVERFNEVFSSAYRELNKNFFLKKFGVFIFFTHIYII